MKLEALMIKAIREFKKVYSNFEIRSIHIAWGSGCWENWKTASFCVEYVEQDGGAYKEMYINVTE